jgi:hypothetical protein
VESNLIVDDYMSIIYSGLYGSWLDIKITKEDPLGHYEEELRLHSKSCRSICTISIVMS